MKKMLMVCFVVCLSLHASDLERAVSAPPVVDSGGPVKNKKNGFESLVSLAQAHARHTKVAPAQSLTPIVQRSKPARRPIIPPVHRSVSEAAGSIRVFVDTPPGQRKCSFTFTMGASESDEESKDEKKKKSSLGDKVAAFTDRASSLEGSEDEEEEGEEEDLDESEDKETSCSQNCAVACTGAGKFVLRVVAVLLCL